MTFGGVERVHRESSHRVTITIPLLFHAYSRIILSDNGHYPAFLCRKARIEARNYSRYSKILYRRNAVLVAGPLWGSNIILLSLLLLPIVPKDVRH